jgi:hypothetical protein
MASQISSKTKKKMDKFVDKQLEVLLHHEIGLLLLKQQFSQIEVLLYMQELTSKCFFKAVENIK